MPNQRGQCTAPCGLLELVGPAAVISHRAAAELPSNRFIRPRFKIGVVDQEYSDLAMQIDIFEIVPIAFGCSDSVADENHWRIGNGHASHCTRGLWIDIAPGSQRQRAAVEPHLEARRRAGNAMYQGNRLCPAA